jgi:hypothetical protein
MEGRLGVCVGVIVFRMGISQIVSVSVTHGRVVVWGVGGRLSRASEGDPRVVEFPGSTWGDVGVGWGPSPVGGRVAAGGPEGEGFRDWREGAAIGIRVVVSPMLDGGVKIPVGEGLMLVVLRRGKVLMRGGVGSLDIFL